jgi:hypothetical protein
MISSHRDIETESNGLLRQLLLVVQTPGARGGSRVGRRHIAVHRTILVCRRARDVAIRSTIFRTPRLVVEGLHRRGCRRAHGVVLVGIVLPDRPLGIYK